VGKSGRDFEVEISSHPITDSFEVVEVAEATSTTASSLDDTVDRLDGC